MADEVLCTTMGNAAKNNCNKFFVNDIAAAYEKFITEKNSMIVLQINVAVNTTSTGKIAERIGLVIQANGHQSVIAYGRKSPVSQSATIKIGTDLDIKLHGLKTRLFDKHAFGSIAATKKN